MSTPAYSARGRVASLTRSRPATDPELIAARQQLAAVNLENYISQVVADVPPLPADVQDRLTGLIRGRAAAAAEAFPPLNAEQRSRLGILLGGGASE